MTLIYNYDSGLRLLIHVLGKKPSVTWTWQEGTLVRKKYFLIHYMSYYPWASRLS